MLGGFHFNDDHMLGDFIQRQLSIRYQTKELLRLALMDNKSFI